MSDSNAYRRNHYVPVWYQRRFLLPGTGDKKFRYLDLHPETVTDSLGRRHTKTALRRWGPANCFCEMDLYTTRLGQWISTEIEQRFFGEVDDKGRAAVDYWSSFEHLKVSVAGLHNPIRFMSLQKLRTPKGLAYLADVTKAPGRNSVLLSLQRLERLFGAIWIEAEWSIVDASDSATKFILSDHPVTVYNLGAFPGSWMCKDWRDPDPWLSGTHTIFPLSLDKALILTNTSWIRNPYGDPLEPRPNPNPMRSAIFKFTDVQAGRKLTSREAEEINYIIKHRARRYVAACKEEWLYPEANLPSTHWSRFGGGLLLMPDPRCVTFAGEVIFGGFPDGRPSEIWDEYGRRPGQQDFADEKQRSKETRTFRAFQGEFARLMGPKHRGSSYQFGRQSIEDSPEYHQALLEEEVPALSKRRRGR